jgi:hypothetical protein
LTTEGKLRIGDEGYAIHLLSQVHGEDPRRPVRELVENSADADATTITVIVNKRATDPYIVCRDNGRGIPRKELIELPARIADSIKREKKEKTGGIHGIGLLSFHTIGNRLRIVSRARGSADTNGIEFEGLKTYAQSPIDRPLDEPGTEACIYGIDREKKLLNAERLAEYLATEFEPHLIEGRFKLEVQQDGKRIPVTREKIISGTPIIDHRKIQTNWGELVINIYYGGKGGVALTRRGVTIVNDIGKLPDVEGEVWKTGKVSGSLRFDSINVSADKKNPVRDELFKVLIKTITEIEPEIAESVKRIDEAEAEKSKGRLYKYLASRFDEVLKGLNFDRIKTLMEGSQKDAITLEAQEAKGVAFSSDGKTTERKEGKPPVSRGDQKKSLRSAYGINWEEESDFEHPNSRSRFDPKFGTVYINKVHSDFTRKVVKAKDDRDKLDYYYKLTVNEIVLHQFEGAPPKEVLGKLLDMQIAMEKAPPTL